MKQDRNGSGKRAAFFYLFAAALLASMLSVPAAAQQQRPAPAGGQKTPPASAAKPFAVRMSKEAPHTFTVKAKDARLSEVAAEFSKLLKVPVNLSPLLQKQNISVDFSGMNLEGALRLLAPHAYVDYVAAGQSAQAQPLAVYLQGVNEPAPSLTATVTGNSEAILIEGHTDEGTEEAEKEEEENPLRVTFAQNQLSVLARKQPLTVVLFRIASEIGVPFELRWESPEMVDLEFSNYSIEQAVRTLSPGVRLYYRMDLQSFDVQPLRLALVSPTANST